MKILEMCLLSLLTHHQDLRLQFLPLIYERGSRYKDVVEINTEVKRTGLNRSKAHTSLHYASTRRLLNAHVGCLFVFIHLVKNK